MSSLFFSVSLGIFDECPPSFLNDLERIASRDYVVSDNDIVRARLRTVGIQEHRLRFKYGPFDNPKGVYPSHLSQLFASL